MIGVAKRGMRNPNVKYYQIPSKTQSPNPDAKKKRLSGTPKL